MMNGILCLWARRILWGRVQATMDRGRVTLQRLLPRTFSIAVVYISITKGSRHLVLQCELECGALDKIKEKCKEDPCLAEYEDCCPLSSKNLKPCLSMPCLFQHLLNSFVVHAEGKLAGVIIGGVVLVGLCIFCCWRCTRNRKTEVHVKGQVPYQQMQGGYEQPFIVNESPMHTQYPQQMQGGNQQPFMGNHTPMYAPYPQSSQGESTGKV